MGIFNVKVFDPYTSSNQKNCHKNEKKRKYHQRIHVDEHASFTPYILSCTGGLGPKATTSYKCLASLLSVNGTRPTIA